MSIEFITLVGGSALLLYSMQALSDSVQYLAGVKFKSWINTFSGSSFSALFLGLVLSVLLSSSGAVSVLLVGLANARLLTLPQILSVTLGSAIGTTLIVQVLAFHLADYSLLIVAIGVAIYSTARTERRKTQGHVFLFLGLMYFSMGLLMSAGIALEKNELFQFSINYFRDRPIISLLIAAGMTAAVHSSAATVAFVMSLMVVRSGSVVEAIPWVLGANLGTTATAYMASHSGGVLGKQVALAQLLVKGVGVVLCFPFMNELGFLAQYFEGGLSRDIANVHTLFNVILAILFFPFVAWGSRVVTYLIPERKEKEGPFNLKFIDSRSLETPELALAQAQREIMRLSDETEYMIKNCISLFQQYDEELVSKIKETDQIVDFLNKKIKLFLTKLSRSRMTSEQTEREFELLVRTNDLESIGDVVDRNILSLVKKHSKKGYRFSNQGWEEIQNFHVKVVECFELSAAYFGSGDRSLASKILILDEQLEALNLELTQTHLKRLHEGVKETLNTTSIHLDLLGSLLRISNLSINCATFRGLRRRH